MSAKQVYLGVRVKVTVKEMLERKRAREADKKRLKMQVSPACLDLQEFCTPAFTSPAGAYVDLPSTFQQADSGSCGAPVLPQQLPVEHYAAADSIQVFGRVQTQFGDGMMPDFGYGDHNDNSGSSSSNSSNMNSGGFSYSPPLPALTSSPQTWSHELNPHADFSGMGSYSSNESLAPYNHWDYYRASPHESSSSSTTSSSSSSCYNSPTRLESSQQMSYLSESYHNQQCSAQPSYNDPHFWPHQPEGPPAVQYPAYNPPEYEWACTMKELNDSTFSGEFSAAPAMCYNIL